MNKINNKYTIPSIQMSKVFDRFGYSDTIGPLPQNLVSEALIDHVNSSEGEIKEGMHVKKQSSEIYVSQELADTYEKLRKIEKEKNNIETVDLTNPENIRFIAISSLFGVNYLTVFDNKILGWRIPFSNNNPDTIQHALNAKGRGKGKTTSMVDKYERFQSRYTTTDNYHPEAAKFIKEDIPKVYRKGYSLGIRLPANEQVPHQDYFTFSGLVQAIIPGHLSEDRQHPSLDINDAIESLTGYGTDGITSANKGGEDTIWNGYDAIHHKVLPEINTQGTFGTFLFIDNNHFGDSVSKKAKVIHEHEIQLYPDNPYIYEKAIRLAAEQHSNDNKSGWYTDPETNEHYDANHVSTTIISIEERLSDTGQVVVNIHRRGSTMPHHLEGIFGDKAIIRNTDNVKQLKRSEYDLV